MKGYVDLCIDMSGTERIFADFRVVPIFCQLTMQPFYSAPCSSQFHCQSWIYIIRSCKASNALYLQVDWEKKVLESRRKLSKEHVECLVASSRLLGQLQRRHDSM